MVLEIVKYGHPVLRKKGERIESITPEIKKLIADMFETMEANHGVGLAAQQVGVAKQLTVIDVSAVTDRPSRLELGGQPADVTKIMPLVLINPEIEVLAQEIEGGWEGCLSVPGLSGFVERPAHIRYRGVDHEGHPIERTAKGFHARVVQHECDHLDGVLYPQRMSDLTKLIFESEARHWARNDEPA